MLAKLDDENSKQYQAFCDFWKLGAQRSIALLEQYYLQVENAPTKNYGTLCKWAHKFKWENRIAAYLEAQQSLLEATYKEKLLEFAPKQFDLLYQLCGVIERTEVIEEPTSLAQYTQAVKIALSEIRSVFNLLPVEKVAPVTPDGKSSYTHSDVNELLELADALKRRPKE